MPGIETFAIEESNTFMKVAKDKQSVPSKSSTPFSGSMGWGALDVELEVMSVSNASFGHSVAFDDALDQLIALLGLALKSLCAQSFIGSGQLRNEVA